jgi:hypothetical protein
LIGIGADLAKLGHSLPGTVGTWAEQKIVREIMVFLHVV